MTLAFVTLRTRFDENIFRLPFSLSLPLFHSLSHIRSPSFTTTLLMHYLYIGHDRLPRCAMLAFFPERKLLVSSDVADLGGIARYTEIATEEAHRRSWEFLISAPVAFKRINSHPIATLLSRYTSFVYVLLWSAWSARHLTTLWITIYWTPFFLLSIVIVEQSVHIKYTKSTQRQKRLDGSRKIAYKISSPLSPPPIFFFLFLFLLIPRPTRRAGHSFYIWHWECAIADPYLRRRDRIARARDNNLLDSSSFLFFFIRPLALRSLALVFFSLSLCFSFLFDIVVILCCLKRHRTGDCSRIKTTDPTWRMTH